MFKPLTPETVKVLNEAIQAAAQAQGVTLDPATPIHVVGVRICDHCLDDDEEAFPYYVEDRDGNFWQHLCNDCFDELGCAYPEVE